MANLQETATWESGIYQLEVTDPVLGGPDGVDNRAPRQLANRTLYLKGQVDTVKNSLTQTNNNVSNLNNSKEDKSTVSALATRIAELERKSAVFAAGGGMVLWQKPANQIPAGWAEVQNWRGRLPMGWNPSDPDFQLNYTGGNKTVTLSTSNMPPHDHKMFANVKVNGLLTSSNQAAYADAGENYLINGTPTSATMGRTSSEGNATPINILNPYRIVIFIEYVG